MDKLYALVALILALSVASERLVEIIKGLSPWLDKAKTDSRGEGHRRAALQGLAVLAGLLTAVLAQPVMPEGILPKGGLGTGVLTTVALGLLASGGSGFWNAILSYVGKVKDVKSLEVSRLRKQAVS